MNARTLLTDQVTTVSVESTVADVRNLMQELYLTQIPVLDAEKFSGIIMLEDLLSIRDLTVEVGQLNRLFRKAKVSGNAHLMDVIKVGLQQQSKVVAVVEEDDTFLGIISAEICLRQFGLLSSAQDSGGVLELDIAIRDYSLTELSRIIENNDCKILCLFTNTDTVKQRVQITLKLNLSDLSDIVQALERHGYVVNALYNEEGYTEDLKDRYDSFMKYLNI